METHLVIALTNPADGRTDEFNQWYDDTHVPDVLSVPGIISAQRLTLTIGDGCSYAAVYEIRADDPVAVVDEMKTRVRDGRIRISHALDLGSMKLLVGSPLGSKRTS